MARDIGRKKGTEPTRGRRGEGAEAGGRGGSGARLGRERGTAGATEIPIRGGGGAPDSAKDTRAEEAERQRAMGASPELARPTGGTAGRAGEDASAGGLGETSGGAGEIGGTTRAAEARDAEGGGSEAGAAGPLAGSSAAGSAMGTAGAETGAGTEREGEERRRRERRQNWGGLAPRVPTHPSLFSLSPLDVLSASPFELMRRFSEEMDRAFEGLGGWSGRGGRAVWSPAVEAFEREGEFVVRAELPGLRKEDLKVEVTDQGVIIEGERRHEQEERREGFYRSERSYGRFSRVVPLPYESVEVEKARAEFRDGVLEVALPIPQAQRRRRRIEIESGRGGAGRGSERGQG